MKTLTLLAITACIAMSCSQSTPPEMKGAYKMLSQNVKGDTTDQTNTNPQLKIYTEGYMMYSNFNPADSSSALGISTYIVNNSVVVETAIYSASGAAVYEGGDTYTLLIEKTEKGYKQIINEMTADSGEKFKLTEEYETVSTAQTSPLDGAWMMSSGLYINEKGDTTRAEGIKQYKVFYAGNVMYGHTWLDSLKVSHAGMGFGTFEMNGDNAAKENIQTSTYAGAAGSYDLNLTFNGPDEYTQVIKADSGRAMSSETYKKLGK